MPEFSSRTAGMPDFTTRSADWIAFEDALQRVLSGVSASAARGITLREAEGLAVGDEVRARYTLPPCPTSHMDGYAFRTTDLKGADRESRLRPLEVVGTSRPGAPFGDPLPRAGAVRIMTGAHLPTGADQVCPVEKSDREAGKPGFVELRPAPSGGGALQGEPGRHVRPAGEEVRQGDTLARPGDTLTFGLSALLAGAGEWTVAAHPAPRVALLVTGDELAPVGEAEHLADGLRRVDILSPTLPRLIRSAGGIPCEPRRAGDDRNALCAALSEAARDADLILTTGGASMGEADLVKDALDTLDFELDFWRIRMRPGSPVSFGHLPRPDGTVRVPVLGLPGNPVSAMVTCIVLGLPAIRALGGHRRRFLPRSRCVSRDTFAGPANLTRFFRVRLEVEEDGRWGVYSPASQGSGAVRSMALADGLAVVPEGAESPSPGDDVDVLLLPHGAWMGSP